MAREKVIHVLTMQEVTQSLIGGGYRPENVHGAPAGLVAFSAPRVMRRLGREIPRIYAILPAGGDSDHCIIGWPHINGVDPEGDALKLAVENCIGRRNFFRSIHGGGRYLGKIGSKFVDSMFAQALPRVESS